LKYKILNSLKNSEDRDAIQRVFDRRTIELLQKFLRNLKIDEIIGIISQGKEANVYFAYGPEKKPIAIKIYKIDVQSAKWMQKYIKGDRRFKKIGNSIDKIVFTWCQKEFKNLKQMYRKGIKCPEPIFFKNNILIMSYIGENDGTPALRLKDSVNLIENLEKEMETSIKFLKDMYQKANLAHGDFSEFNILYFNNEQVVIDVSQAVDVYSHPMALKLLARDIENILKFYKKLNLETPDPLGIYNEIIDR